MLGQLFQPPVGGYIGGMLGGYFCYDDQGTRLRHAVFNLVGCEENRFTTRGVIMECEIGVIVEIS